MSQKAKNTPKWAQKNESKNENTPKCIITTLKSMDLHFDLDG